MMMMIKLTNNNIFLAIIVSVICVLAFILGRRSKADSVIESQPINVDTVFKQNIDTIHITDTVTMYRPQPIKTDTIFIADTQTQEVAQHIKKTYEVDSLQIDTTSKPHGMVSYHLLVRTDNYDVDSIALRFNVDYPKIIQTKTITKTVTKKKHWNYGIQTGFGYGIYNRKPDLYIGVGLQYNM